MGFLRQHLKFSYLDGLDVMARGHFFYSERKDKKGKAKPIAAGDGGVLSDCYGC